VGLLYGINTRAGDVALAGYSLALAGNRTT
jgi:hypothetical protein